MITSTSFTVAVYRNLAKALRTAQKEGRATVKNRKGKAYIDVLKVNVEGRCKYLFTCSKTGENLALLINKGLLRLFGGSLFGFHFLDLFNNRLAYTFHIEGPATHKAQIDAILETWDAFACYSDSPVVARKQREREATINDIISSAPYKVLLQNYFDKRVAALS